MSVAERVKEARDGLYLTQNELAVRLDTTSTTISRWERGDAEPSRRMLRRLADLCGRPVAWFFTENGEEANVA